VNIIPVIRDLLLRHQKAVVPGFGTFFIIQRPAQLNKVTRVLTPPATVVRFDKNQQLDDGQLAGYLAGKLKMKDADALMAIEQFSKITVSGLIEKGSVVLEGLGILTREKSGDYSFSPDEDILKRINLVELPKINIPSQPEKVQPPLVKPPEVIIHKKKRRWIPAAILVLVVGLGAGIYFTGIYKNMLADLKGTGINKEEIKEDEKLVFGKPNEPDSSQVKKDSLRDQISRELDEKISREKALAFKEETKKPEPEPKAEEIRKSVKPAPVMDQKAYHIIAGAFLVPNNAERQAELLNKKGYTATVLPKRGDYFMVSLGSYDNSDEATTAMRQIKGKIENQLWVLKR
jgi:nucleoid DNA-binding protein